MNATEQQQRLLLDVAELDRRIQQAERARTQPAHAARINELSALRQEQLRELTLLTGSRDDAAAELRRLEADVAVVEQRRARDADRLAASTNAKDAQALERELASLAKRTGDLEDQELEVMAKLEEAQAAVTAQQAVIDATTAEGTELTGQAKAGIAAATAEGEQLARDRTAVAGGIDAALLAEYDRRATRTTGAALLRRGTCEGCRMVLSGTDLTAIRQAPAEQVVSCPECGCILVRTEESGL
ncbi:zinc ribbon domain-containing protein [Microbacterium sp. NPDC055903]